MTTVDFKAVREARDTLFVACSTANRDDDAVWEHRRAGGQVVLDLHTHLPLPPNGAEDFVFTASRIISLAMPFEQVRQRDRTSRATKIPLTQPRAGHHDMLLIEGPVWVNDLQTEQADGYITWGDIGGDTFRYELICPWIQRPWHIYLTRLARGVLLTRAELPDGRLRTRLFLISAQIYSYEDAEPNVGIMVTETLGEHSAGTELAAGGEQLKDHPRWHKIVDRATQGFRDYCIPSAPPYHQPSPDEAQRFQQWILNSTTWEEALVLVTNEWQLRVFVETWGPRSGLGRTLYKAGRRMVERTTSNVNPARAAYLNRWWTVVSKELKGEA